MPASYSKKRMLVPICIHVCSCILLLLSALSEFSHFVHWRQFLGQICKIFLYKRHFHIQRQKVIFNEFSNGRASKVEHHSPFELRILKNFSSSLRRMFFFREILEISQSHFELTHFTMQSNNLSFRKTYQNLLKN